MWNFDGVACAAALELGQPAFFFHANHLLYGFFGYLFWKWIEHPFGLERALPALQLFTSMASAIGLVGLFRLLRTYLKNDGSANLLTLGLSVTAAFWVWSIEAQVYSLGFLALAWATYVLLAYQETSKYTWVAILHAGAVLGHVMHVLWVIPALYWMWGDEAAIKRYLSLVALFTIIPYLLVLGFVIVPVRGAAHTLIWLKGSAGLTLDRRWAWHFPGLKGPWIYLKSTAPALWGIFRPYQDLPRTLWMGVLAALSIGIFLAIIVRGVKQKSQKVTHFCWLWFAAYGLLLSTWEPTTLCYRMTDIIPFGLLLAIGLRAWPPARQIILAAMFFGTTLALNASTQILPMHEIKLNRVYQDTLSLSKITPPDSLYITHGGPPWIYLLYFTGRTAWNADLFDHERLAEEIERQKREHPVYVLEGLQWQRVL